jgi:hypothetical protein
MKEKNHREAGSKQNYGGSLFGLLFSTEDGRDIFLRKAS